MVCLRNICINTLPKGDDDDDDNNNNILVNEQFGFREKLPTEMATYTLLNNVLSLFDLKKFCWWFILQLVKSV